MFVNQFFLKVLVGQKLHFWKIIEPKLLHNRIWVFLGIENFDTVAKINIDDN